MPKKYCTNYEIDTRLACSSCVMESLHCTCLDCICILVAVSIGPDSNQPQDLCLARLAVSMLNAFEGAVERVSYFSGLVGHVLSASETVMWPYVFMTGGFVGCIFFVVGCLLYSVHRLCTYFSVLLL